MTLAEFKMKWFSFQGNEASNYAEHFNDLCRTLSQFDRAKPADVAEILETLVNCLAPHELPQPHRTGLAENGLLGSPAT